MHEGAVSTRLGLSGQPGVAEAAAVARDLLVAELTGGRLHVAHLSTGARARSRAGGRRRAGLARDLRGDAAPPRPDRRGSRV